MMFMYSVLLWHSLGLLKLCETGTNQDGVLLFRLDFGLLPASSQLGSVQIWLKCTFMSRLGGKKRFMKVSRMHSGVNTVALSSYASNGRRTKRKCSCSGASRQTDAIEGNMAPK